MEKLDVKALRDEAVREAQTNMEEAVTTKEKHYARLTLHRATQDRDALQDADREELDAGQGAR